MYGVCLPCRRASVHRFVLSGLHPRFPYLESVCTRWFFSISLQRLVPKRQQRDVFLLCFFFRGLQLLQQKYGQKQFGVCPNSSCEGWALLPTALTDTPNKHTAKVFCAKCCVRESLWALICLARGVDTTDALRADFECVSSSLKVALSSRSCARGSVRSTGFLFVRTACTGYVSQLVSMTERKAVVPQGCSVLENFSTAP